MCQLVTNEKCLTKNAFFNENELITIFLLKTVCLVSQQIRIYCYYNLYSVVRNTL